MNIKTNILLITYNRSDLTRAQLENLTEMSDRIIYVFSDGSRQNSIEDVTKNQSVINEFNERFPNRIRVNLQEKNLGCGRGVIRAIDWAFSFEEQLIILEDDCSVAKEFFSFCDYALTKYSESERVFGIASENKLRYDGNTSKHYYEIDFPLIWGWATWKRSWNKYEFDAARCLDNFQLIQNRDDLSERNKRYLKKNLIKVRDNKIDTWDYQMLFALQSNKMSFLVPDCNLVQNTGFRRDATHTIRGKAPKMSFGKLNTPYSFTEEQAYNEYLKQKFFIDRNILQKLWYKLFFQ